MPRKFYTILILPHAHSRLKKIHFSKNFVWSIAGLLTLLVLVGASAPHILLKMSTQGTTVERLRAENRVLREEKLQFETTLSGMTNRMHEYESHAGLLAEALGVTNIPSSEPAAGGARALRPSILSLQKMLDDDLDVLNTRANTLGRSMEMIDGAWEERLLLLAATPGIRPVEGFFSHGFGWRRHPISKKREFHQGVDIVANRGTPIRSTADGVITRATRYMGYGKMVHISHGYGMATRYGHMSEILVRAGQRVKRGDIIGKVGSTGRSTGPHLHYEVFQAGRRVDPRKFLGDKSF
jgi:murein DD-endopeptidase MepM/ murein hydrolase activator NlpD